MLRLSLAKLSLAVDTANSYVSAARGVTARSVAVRSRRRRRSLRLRVATFVFAPVRSPTQLGGLALARYAPER